MLQSWNRFKSFLLSFSTIWSSLLIVWVWAVSKLENQIRVNAFTLFLPCDSRSMESSGKRTYEASTQKCINKKRTSHRCKNTMCIRVLDELNLIWRFDLWLDPIFATAAAASKNTTRFKSYQKWSKNNRLTSFTKV